MHSTQRKPHQPRGQAPRRCRARHTALGQAQAWAWSNGDSASRSFDTDARLTRTEFSSYVFDAASRITSITQNLWASLSSTDAATGTTSTKLSTTPITWAASYDSRNRLTSFGRTGTSTSYTYDTNSNRLSSIDTRTRDTDINGSFDQATTTTTTAQATNQALSIASDSNRLLGFTQTLSTTSAGTSSTTGTQVSYTLDANGNLTSDGQHHFIYDAANRLNQVDIVQGEQASNVTYLHNALGQRVFKSELQEAQLVSNVPQPDIDLIDLFIQFFYWLFNIAPADAILGQSYLYDDATLGDSPSLLGEYGNGGTLSQGNAEYIWLPTESGQAQLIGLYKNQRFYAIHTDHLGTPRLITDDANQVVWQWAYSAFGDNQPTGILQATPNPDTSASPAVLLKATAPQLTMNLRMAGQYFDEESGLFENGFRSYRPGMGAYTQPDLIGLGGGLNRYGYVGGDPLNYSDPMGLQAIPIPLLPMPGVPNPSMDAQRELADRLNRALRNDQEKTYQTYTRYNPLTGDCYSGRTSGNDTPEANVRNRSYGQPLLNAEGFLPPVLDRSSTSYSAIRGREQQLIELNGGARSSGGSSRNMINGISRLNPAGPLLRDRAASEFGTPIPAGKCTCQ